MRLIKEDAIILNNLESPWMPFLIPSMITVGIVPEKKMPQIVMNVPEKHTVWHFLQQNCQHEIGYKILLFGFTL